VNVSKQASSHSSIPEPSVVVRGDGVSYAQNIVAGSHRLIADEPIAAGGTNSGPTPYDLLLAALGACTSMTVGMYARRKNWPLQGVVVRLRHARIHAEDCATCETKDGFLDRIECELELAGELSTEQRSKLLEISEKCPVHRTLQSRIEIRSSLL
jgi:putative redox protein